MERLDDVCSRTSMYGCKHVRSRTAHVRDCTYIQSHDMPNILFLVLIYGNIPFKLGVHRIALDPQSGNINYREVEVFWGGNLLPLTWSLGGRSAMTSLGAV